MDSARLVTIKKMLGITGSYHDDLLLAYGTEVEQYLLDAGVKKSVLALPEVTGIFARGIADLWNYGAGAGQLSPYFMQRATQLAYKLTKSEEHELCHVSEKEINEMMGVSVPEEDEKHKLYHVSDEDINEMMGVKT